MGLGLTLHRTQEVNASLCFHRFTCTPYNLRTEERAPDFRNLESVQIKLNKNRAQLPQRAARAAVAVVLFAEVERATYVAEVEARAKLGAEVGRPRCPLRK